MSKRGRPSRLSKKKAERILWSRNANAAKARKRLERPEREVVPGMVRCFPWEVTVRNVLDGANVTLKVRSGRHAKAFLDAVFLYEA